ncbi:4-(cytidine 5'-diphospho)-2-C-methyl-D-erythritol kinase [uncultured Roseobacter sp.]|uniref:4-(cytidine 5'-diphospho)-2-C-methyl-D-erythritol kinase n=1 Tax=uncultured Roseobacter sp. TaxID=114847 RepID=UPI0026323F0F|nr:4-(cytidine 5'-diphospho)-2-C-methyl-D-erythritol kinase [uncultured Roseobacter sp.]
MTQSDPKSVRIFAPAKINLTLHVVGQRSDGYHLIDSLVAFADIGDIVELTVGPREFSVSGPEAQHLGSEDSNLVVRVAKLFPGLPDLSIALTKNLPVASGIGGGSADAAATFRGLAAMQAGQAVPKVDQLLELGADIPMCVSCAAARIRGIGQEITILPKMPSLHAVLVNPRAAVSTPKVFQSLPVRKNPPMPVDLPSFAGASEFADWLLAQRNDLQATAIALEPSIETVIQALESQPGCLMARMSGSGATCFGVFKNADASLAAAKEIGLMHPEWWVQATHLGTQSGSAQPQIS